METSSSYILERFLHQFSNCPKLGDLHLSPTRSNSITEAKLLPDNNTSSENENQPLSTYNRKRKKTQFNSSNEENLSENTKYYRPSIIKPLGACVVTKQYSRENFSHRTPQKRIQKRAKRYKRSDSNSTSNLDAFLNQQSCKSAPNTSLKGSEAAKTELFHNSVSSLQNSSSFDSSRKTNESDRSVKETTPKVESFNNDSSTVSSESDSSIRNRQIGLTKPFPAKFQVSPIQYRRKKVTVSKSLMGIGKRPRSKPRYSGNCTRTPKLDDFFKKQYQMSSAGSSRSKDNKHDGQESIGSKLSVNTGKVWPKFDGFFKEQSQKCNLDATRRKDTSPCALELVGPKLFMKMENGRPKFDDFFKKRFKKCDVDPPICEKENPYAHELVDSKLMVKMENVCPPMDEFVKTQSQKCDIEPPRHKKEKAYAAEAIGSKLLMDVETVRPKFDDFFEEQPQKLDVELPRFENKNPYAQELVGSKLPVKMGNIWPKLDRFFKKQSQKCNIESPRCENEKSYAEELIGPKFSMEMENVCPKFDDLFKKPSQKCNLGPPGGEDKNAYVEECIETKLLREIENVQPKFFKKQSRICNVDPLRCGDQKFYTQESLVFKSPVKMKNVQPKLDRFLKQSQKSNIESSRKENKKSDSPDSVRSKLSINMKNVGPDLFQYFRKSKRYHKEWSGNEAVGQGIVECLKKKDDSVPAPSGLNCNKTPLEILDKNLKTNKIDSKAKVFNRNNSIKLDFPLRLESERKFTQTDPFIAKSQDFNVKKDCHNSLCEIEEQDESGNFNAVLKSMSSYFVPSKRIANSEIGSVQSFQNESERHRTEPILESQQLGGSTEFQNNQLLSEGFHESMSYEAENEIQRKTIEEDKFGNTKLSLNSDDIQSTNSIQRHEDHSKFNDRGSTIKVLHTENNLLDEHIYNNDSIKKINTRVDTGLQLNNKNLTKDSLSDPLSFGSSFKCSGSEITNNSKKNVNTNCSLMNFNSPAISNQEMYSQRSNSLRLTPNRNILSASDQKLQKSKLDPEALENLYRIHESNNWDLENQKMDNVLKEQQSFSSNYQDLDTRNTFASQMSKKNNHSNELVIGKSNFSWAALNTDLPDRFSYIQGEPGLSQKNRGHIASCATEEDLVLTQESGRSTQTEHFTRTNHLRQLHHLPQIECSIQTQHLSHSEHSTRTQHLTQSECLTQTQHLTESECLTQTKHLTQTEPSREKRKKTYTLTENCLLFEDNLLKDLMEEKPKIVKLYNKNKPKKPPCEEASEILAKTYIKRYRKGRMKIYKIKRRLKQTLQAYQSPEDQIMDNFIKRLKNDFKDQDTSNDVDETESISTPSSYKTDETKSEVLSSGSAKLPDHQKLLREGINRLSKNRALLFSRFSDSAPEEPEGGKILARIQKIICGIVDDYEHGRNPSFKIPKEDISNCVFHDERYQLKKSPDMVPVSYNNRMKRSRFNLLLLILNKIRVLLETGAKLTKREIYYQLKSMVNSQSVTDRAIKEISRMLNVGVWAMNVTAQKGMVFGNLKLVMDNGETINCNVPGTLVPKDVLEICEIHSDAYFILVVEKESIFHKLLEENLPSRLTRPFILITGKGFPDHNTQLFLKKLWMVMTIPVFILVDADPDGVSIMLTYRFGSVASAHVSDHLAIPKARWIGVFPSEILTLNLDHQTLCKREVAKTKSLLQLRCVNENEPIKRQVETFLKEGVKTGIESVMKTETYLSHRYLSFKFYNNDLI